jgi:hypothetical protein
MSIKLIEREICRFLSSTEPEVICISGHWGVGKTFAWNKFLKQASDRKEIGLKRYAYVSLFGVNSLDELKYAVFENSVKTTEIGVEPSLETLQSNTVAAVERFGRKSLWFVQQIPFVKNYVGGMGPVWFMSVKDTIICLDDIERRGKGLHIRDIMGLASTLKEHKHCKAVLILNDEALEADKAEFETYYEKVVDSTLRFAPTATECADIALAGKTKTDRLLRENCLALGISNIRVIKKIEQSVRKIEPMLGAFDEEVLFQASHSLSLLGWSLYEPAKAPPLEFLKRRKHAHFFDHQENIPANEASWNALLEAYRFTALDEFDLLLLQGLRDGYFDEVAVEAQARELDRIVTANKHDNSFAEAWRLYHDSFEDNETQVLEAINGAFVRNVRNISLTNLNGTVRLFKDLGWTEKAGEIIRCYVESHGENQSAFDLENFPFRENVTDPDVVTALNAKFETFHDDRDVAKTLLGMSNGWSPDDVRFLSRLPADEFYALFKNNSGRTLHKLINACLQFDRIVNASNPMRTISRKAKEALSRIGNESRINSRRVAKYGIAPEPGGAPPALPANEGGHE